MKFIANVSFMLDGEPVNAGQELDISGSMAAHLEMMRKESKPYITRAEVEVAPVVVTEKPKKKTRAKAKAPKADNAKGG